MTERQVLHALIDHKKTTKQLAAEMRQLGVKVADTQIYDVLAENGRRTSGVIEKVLEGAEKVIRKWEENAAKKKTAP